MAGSAHLRPLGDVIGLAPDRCGPQRGSGLTGAERDLYRALLLRFAHGGTTAAGDIASDAATLGLDAAAALRHMEELDLVRLGADGAIGCAYPFSALPTAHRVLLDGTAHAVHAMCAVDALGIPLMLRRPGVVTFTDPVSGRDLTVRMTATGLAGADPSDPVMVVAHRGDDGPLAQRCCPLLNLYESAASAARHLLTAPDVTGVVISLPEAVEVARAVFAGVLD